MSEVFIYRGNLINADTDCIVNPANSLLMPAEGVNRTIFYSAGDELYNCCMNMDNVNLGEACATPGFNIPVKNIIHTVAPYWYGGYENEAAILASCYVNSLKLAVSLGLKSIAFPALSTGNGHYPVKEAAEIAIYSIKSFLQNHPDVDIKVYMMCYTDKTLFCFRDANIATDLDILKYLKRKNIKINKMKLTKEESVLVKKSIFKKDVSQEKIDKMLYSVLQRITSKKKSLILLSSKMTKDKITSKTCKKHKDKKGPYVTLDTVKGLQIHEVKRGPFLVPESVSFIIEPYAYLNDQNKEQVSSTDKKAFFNETQNREEKKPVYISIEDELLVLEKEYKKEQEPETKVSAESAGKIYTVPDKSSKEPKEKGE